jgi:mRNA interferase RelE/StbE
VTYRVVIEPAAARALRRLPRDAQERLLARLEELAEEPRPRGVRRLAGPEQLYRVRVGDYRIIYEIRDRDLLLLVVVLGHRREVYRRR